VVGQRDKRLRTDKIAISSHACAGHFCRTAGASAIGGVGKSKSRKASFTAKRLMSP
jgi:hypothetical protein